MNEKFSQIKNLKKKHELKWHLLTIYEMKNELNKALFSWNFSQTENKNIDLENLIKGTYIVFNKIIKIDDNLSKVLVIENWKKNIVNTRNEIAKILDYYGINNKNDITNLKINIEGKEYKNSGEILLEILAILWLSQNIKEEELYNFFRDNISEFSELNLRQTQKRLDDLKQIQKKTENSEDSVLEKIKLNILNSKLKKIIKDLKRIETAKKIKEKSSEKNQKKTFDKETWNHLSSVLGLNEKLTRTNCDDVFEKNLINYKSMNLEELNEIKEKLDELHKKMVEYAYHEKFNEENNDARKFVRWVVRDLNSIIRDKLLEKNLEEQKKKQAEKEEEIKQHNWHLFSQYLWNFEDLIKEIEQNLKDLENINIWDMQKKLYDWINEIYIDIQKKN